MNFEQQFLYPILDDSRSIDVERDALESIRAGAKILQIRSKKLTKRELFDLIKKILPQCDQVSATLIVNDHVDVALLTGAPGIHLGQEDFPVLEARKLLPNAIIGISTHNLNQIQEANNLPVDYISIGPVFETSSKKNPDPVVGISLLKKARSITQKPIVCIGGIQKKDIPTLIDEGANGIAFISELYKNDDIFGNVKRLLESFTEPDEKV
jgi:thiamine-phosphate pyrophosphorylase